MIKEIISPKRGTVLRKNGNQNLTISVIQSYYEKLFLINGTSFHVKNLSDSDFLIKPNDHYMIINNGNDKLEINYNHDISYHEIIYDPYKYEKLLKVVFKHEDFKDIYDIPHGYIDTLPKWYSFKFTYPEYNLIFIKPELGLSIQTHQKRNETWEILDGNPIIIIGDKVHYYAKKGMIFQNPIKSYHSIINPSKNPKDFVILKESWSGTFDEKDIERIFNPNQYFD